MQRSRAIVFEMFFQLSFWVALAQIIGVNIVLSGDNAVVIALACRSLSPAQQRKGIIFGSAGAILLRIVLTFFAATLLQIPYLKLAGAALLVWIGIKLLVSDDKDDGSGIKSHTELSAAIKTIITADVVMSLDNVIGVAAAARGDFLLMVLGLLISIPLIVFGSTFIMRLMDRFPIIITGGGALLGYVAGEMAITDIGIQQWVDQNVAWTHYVLPFAMALVVVLAGTWLDRRLRRRSANDPLDDLAESEASPRSEATD
jgi:YjbE family integral membrane protein